MTPKKIAPAIVLFCVFLALPISARDWERENGFRRDMPVAARTVVFHRQKFWFHEGRFYRRYRNGYVIAEAPMGAVVVSLPVGFTTVVVGPRKYFCYENIYYLQTPDGYQVVSPPAVIVHTPAPTPTEADNVFTVTLVNADGTKTDVTITKTTDGFLGPQGEFYATFPKISQLKVMYGK